MKRLMQWMLAAILICGSTVFTSCSKDDNPATPDLNLSEKIIGKWIVADINGQPASTNDKKVVTFVSATKAYLSASYIRFTEAGSHWINQLEADVVIKGNKITLTDYLDEHTTAVNEYNVTAINNSEFSANRKLTITADGAVVVYVEENVRYVKVPADYKEVVLGTWEGHVTNSEGSEYDDGEMHRWEYKADGNFVYYVQNEEGEWVPSSNTLNEYFVDGVLLCTRWVDNDIENREWWEIASIKDGVMKWKALRQREDGSTYTATFQMTKVVE